MFALASGSAMYYTSDTGLGGGRIMTAGEDDRLLEAPLGLNVRIKWTNTAGKEASGSLARMRKVNTAEGLQCQTKEQ